MLYVQQTYNMLKSLCLSGFAVCHVIRLYVFAKFFFYSAQRHCIRVAKP